MPWELVIVDNGSADETRVVAERAARHDFRVRLVDAPDAHNLSYVRNVGAHHARGRSLVFVDDDDVVAPGWLEAMAVALGSHALVASRLEYGLLNEPGSLVGRGRFQTDHVEELFSLPVLTGAGHGCRRTLWELLGGNDERFAETGEDFVDHGGDALRIREEALPGCTHLSLDHPRRGGLSHEPFVVPEGRYYFLGDNRDNSNDSRGWGTVPRTDLKGPVIVNYWSWNNQESWAAMLNPLTWLRLLSGEMRWGRIGMSYDCGDEAVDG